MVMRLQEEPLEPLPEYEQNRQARIKQRQATLAASGLGATVNELDEATQPTAKKSKKRRTDQENIPKVLCPCGCGANTCCAQSHHKWLPPSSLRLCNHM